jgi:glycosyltransferase involved in cell wall biosynthesis
LFADLNVVLSAHTERRFAEAGLAPERMRRIPPAIDPLALRSEHERTALRKQLGLPVSAPIVLFPGDLEFGEGATLMVEAARALRPDVHIVLACRVKTPSARAAADRLFTRVVDLGLIARVRFIGDTPRIHDLLACADVVALPSVDLYAKMDYPLVLLEAMSLARSVIVAEGSAAAELSHTGGAIALSASVESLAAGVQRLLEDDAARSRLGSAARDAVLAHYTYAQMASAYEHLYDQLLA